ncbi:NAD(P)-binding protein [Exidia glandulosa HHB12029]|uniref:NAD(P)-binding protein n=1 Tax=Exidia glandulosa HHB12029 TaxID=1314781 RepID=A0A165F1G3_EXIGL|nr:NAD(P)-binding protein [Exidia glandulosa HHB12029]
MPTWLVTGTSRGIGLELVRQLAAKDANTVIATCRSPSSAAALGELASAHKNLHVIPLDITSEESIREAFEAVKGLLGPSGSIDYLINNAGIGSGETIVDATPAEMERQFRTHVIGPMLVFRTFLPLVEAGSRKVVVNVTSGLASIGLDIGPKNASYSIAKAGMNMLTYKTARQYPHITIFVMDPGWVKTEMGGPDAMIDADFAVSKHIQLYEAAKLETHAGKFWSYEGKELPW